LWGHGARFTTIATVTTTGHDNYMLIKAQSSVSCDFKMVTCHHVPPQVWRGASLNSELTVLTTAYCVAISAQIRIAKENKLALQIRKIRKIRRVLHPSPKPVSFLLWG
jgi:hypothetical protein